MLVSDVMRQRRLIMSLLSLGLLACAVWCFILSGQYFDQGIMYVAETSSNPHPSETAKVMGPYLMDKSRSWLLAGVGCVALLVVALLLNKAASNKALKLTRR
jgi:hypothetical protein